MAMDNRTPVPTAASLRTLLDAGKEQEAFAAARTLADAGDPDGHLLLGWMYQTAVGVERNDDEAEDHYLTAANQGSALGMFYLGWFYSTNRDLERAVEWFTRSSDSGCSAATYHLGRMYLAGHGVEKNEEQAAQCFETAARQGHLFARMYVARRMLRGRYGIARIPVGLFKALQTGVAFARIGTKDPESEFLLRVGGHRFNTGRE